MVMLFWACRRLALHVGVVVRTGHRPIQRCPHRERRRHGQPVAAHLAPTRIGAPVRWWAQNVDRTGTAGSARCFATQRGCAARSTHDSSCADSRASAAPAPRNGSRRADSASTRTTTWPLEIRWTSRRRSCPGLSAPGGHFSVDFDVVGRPDRAAADRIVDHRAELEIDPKAGPGIDPDAAFGHDVQVPWRIGQRLTHRERCVRRPTMPHPSARGRRPATRAATAAPVRSRTRHGARARRRGAGRARGPGRTRVRRRLGEDRCRRR